MVVGVWCSCPCIPYRDYGVTDLVCGTAVFFLRHIDGIGVSLANVVAAAV